MAIRKADSLQGAISAVFGPEAVLEAKRPVYGGDINQAARLELSDGRTAFMKSNTPARLSLFEAESLGLEMLRQPNVIGVPQALALGTDHSLGLSFLVMEYIPSAPPKEKYWEIFGHQLALLHRADCTGFLGAGTGRYGLCSDNFIGTTRQSNTPCEKWSEFFRDCRLQPQIRLAGKKLSGRMIRQANRLMEHLDDYLPEPERPSLLHGDLWSGNALCGPDGQAWILDPAVYVGHHEADLAMTELFGGFSPAFYAAYQEIYPIDRGYRERREIYNLYHLLNHVNLFGESYLSPVAQILDRFG